MAAADPKFWDNLAEDYAAQPLEDPDAFERKIAITKSLMAPDDVVLDIGCGTGSLALRLAVAGSELHGLDLSTEMIRIARQKAEAQNVENTVFHVGPFDDSFAVLDDGTLDGVCAYSILHLLPDREAAIRQIHRLLKPGGFFVSSTVCLGDSWVPYRPLLTVMRWLGKAPPVTVLRLQTLIAEFEAAGFVDIECPDVGAKDTIAFVTARKAVR